VLGLCALWRSRPSGDVHRVADFLPSVENIAFLLFVGGVGTLQLLGTVGTSGPLCTSWDRPSGATHWAVGYSFPPLSGEVFIGEPGALLWLGTVGTAGSFYALGKQISCHPQNGRLPLNGEPGFPLFDSRVEAFLWEDLVVSAGFPCSVERVPPGATRIAKHGAWGSLVCVIVGWWHWIASWGSPWGSKAGGLELSGVQKAAEALGSTCVGAWALRGHSSCCRHGGTKPVGIGIYGACLLGAGSRRAVQ
jgi:hypothetical protein